MQRRDMLIPWEIVNSYLKEHEIVGSMRHTNKYLGLIQEYFPGQDLLTVKKLAELLGLSRLSIERNFLGASMVHYDVQFVIGEESEGRRTAPRDRLYVCFDDLKDFLVHECELVYEQNTVETVPFEVGSSFRDLLSRTFPVCRSALVHRRERRFVAELPDQQQRLLVRLLLNSFWTTLADLQKVTERSRSSMILLGYMVDSVQFTMAGRTARRYLIQRKIPLGSRFIELMLHKGYKLPILSEEMVYGDEPIEFLPDPEEDDESNKTKAEEQDQGQRPEDQNRSVLD
jgi:hypothetical protein